VGWVGGIAVESNRVFIYFVPLVIILSASFMSGCNAVAPLPEPAATAANTATALLIKTPPPESSLTPTQKPSATNLPTPVPTDTPWPTPTLPSATIAARATIMAFGTVCDAPAEDWSAGLSPDGNWIAVSCRGSGGKDDSYLRILSLQGVHDWVIHFSDYVRNDYYDPHDEVAPFHWSNDGKYLYAISSSRLDGCCWIGNYRLLVRLNLENGRQDELLNYDFPNDIPIPVDISISPNERYVLYIPQQGNNDLYVLDLYTWKQRIIQLKYENTGAGYTIMSEDGKKVALTLMEFPEEQQGDFTFGSIVLIDLESGSQRKLLSGMGFDDTPIPVKWEDDDHILLRHDDELLLLNIHTAELEVLSNP
jgi:hypothetical protein